MNILKKFSPENFDWPLAVAMVLLFSLGIMSIYSVDLSRGSELILFRKQVIAFAIGTVLFVFAATRRYTFFYSFSKFAYFISIVFLIAVLIVGRGIRGTVGWFSVGGFNFQPVELAKVGLILLLSYVIYNFGRRFEKPIFFIGTGIITFLMVGLVMLQPDLGSSLLLLAIWFGLMLIAGARKSLIAGFIFLSVLAAVIGWLFVLQPYQKDRVLTFVDPSRDPLSSGYNVSQALIAIGSGKFFGRGLGFGSQSQMRFLPEAQTDFVFSVIGEELGFVGVVVLLGLYVVLFWRLLLIIKRSDNDYVSAVIYGISILFLAQLVVNIGANLGLLPVTGVTLPLVSYGGSSLIIDMLLLGIAESMVEAKY